MVVSDSFYETIIEWALKGFNTFYGLLSICLFDFETVGLNHLFRSPLLLFGAYLRRVMTIFLNMEKKPLCQNCSLLLL